jgi:23S rRNA pseudouridine2604 synthase
MSKRLNKYMSEIGYCSRREADRLIDAGRIKVNGDVATIGTKIEEPISILVDDKPVKKEIESVYIVLNKPVGITSTTNHKDPTNVVDYIKFPQRIFMIGRLDKDSEGLLLLTNDGDIVNKILRSENNHEKEYIVTVQNPINRGFIKNMSRGVTVLGKKTKPAIVKYINKNTFSIVLTEGMNRQIRRMVSALDNRVISLVRVRIMNITNKNLNVGDWRFLTKEEIASIKAETEADE